MGYVLLFLIMKCREWLCWLAGWLAGWLAKNIIENHTVLRKFSIQ